MPVAWHHLIKARAHVANTFRMCSNLNLFLQLMLTYKTET